MRIARQLTRFAVLLGLLLFSVAEAPAQSAHSQQNIDRIRKLREDASTGNAEAEYDLGHAYQDGRGIRKDDKQAAFWFRKAAEQSNAYAQYNLGTLYLMGKGTPQNFEEAYFWLDLAAGSILGPNNKKWVCTFRDAARSHLTQPDFLQAQGRVRKWLETHHADANSH